MSIRGKALPAVGVVVRADVDRGAEGASTVKRSEGNGDPRSAWSRVMKIFPATLPELAHLVAGDEAGMPLQGSQARRLVGGSAARSHRSRRR